MNSSRFKKNEFKKFCALICTKPTIVSKVLSNLDNYYYEKVEVKPNKDTGKPKTYKDGTIKKRIMNPSKNELKEIQRRIKSNILAPIELPAEVHGGVQTKSNITNARPHKGNKYIFTTDLQSFYPNISHIQVYNTFLGLGFSNHFSGWLTKLTTWKYALPQGTPTSTHISNLVFLSTDRRIIELCSRESIAYTRYVDDLTFSSSHNFIDLLDPILLMVRDGGFKISYRKTDYGPNQIVTGIVVSNNKIDAPPKIKEKAQKEIALNDKQKPYLNYVQNIDKVNSNK